jgi:flagellar basal body rod protein FlgB
MRNTFTQFVFFISIAGVLFAGSSCKKTASTPAPPSTVSFTMKDTLIISSQNASTDPSIFTQYNGKTYSIDSKEKTDIITRKKSGTDHFMFYFQDASVYDLQPSFEVIIKNTDVNSFEKEYDLTDASKIQLNYHQRLKDFSVAINMNGKVISGTLKIEYNKQYNTISGEITNLKVPIDFYTPEDVELDLPTRSNILLSEGGSYRAVSTVFTYVEVGSAP